MKKKINENEREIDTFMSNDDLPLKVFHKISLNGYKVYSREKVNEKERHVAKYIEI